MSALPEPSARRPSVQASYERVRSACQVSFPPAPVSCNQQVAVHNSNRLVALGADMDELVERELTVPEPAEEVWRSLAEPEWLGEDASIDLRAAGEVRAG